MTAKCAISTWSDTLIYKNINSELRAKIESVVPFFPELTTVIETAVEFECLNKKHGDFIAQVRPTSFRHPPFRYRVQFLGINEIYSRHTIAHELCHVAAFVLYDQGVLDFPLGEVQTDLWAMSRDVSCCDEEPNYFYIGVPSQDLAPKWLEMAPDLHQIAKQAMLLRKGGFANYSKWARREMTLSCLRYLYPKVNPSIVNRMFPSVLLARA